MKRILLGHDDLVGDWICRRTGGTFIPGSGKTIALVQDDRIIAAVLYDNFNGASIQMHVAAEPGARWMTRQYLFKCFDYPFRQLGCKLVLGLVAENNHAARRFDEHLGFKIQATLKDAHPCGALLIYGMKKDECKWLKQEPENGRQIERTGLP